MRSATANLASPVAAAWLRGGRWTPSWLASLLAAHELHVKAAARRRDDGRSHFMYVGERRPDLLADVHDCGTSRRVVTASDFFSAIEQPDAPSALYLAAPLVELPGLLQHAPGWETLPGSTAATAAPPMAQLWAASTGAVTQCHYDVADNTFVQLSGEKEFLLWPPEAHAALHLFPDCHPRSRKAQLDLERPDRAAHPLSEALPPPLRLVLSAGDVLRLPAFWMHHVTSLTPTVSLNVFADYSGVRAAASDALRLDVPLHAAWPDELKRRGLATLLPPLLAAARGGAPPAPFLRQMIASRFEPLAAALPASPPSSEPSEPSSSLPPRRRLVPPPPSWADLEPALREAAADGIEALERLRCEADVEAARGPSAPASWAALRDHGADAPPGAPRDGCARHPQGVLELTAAHLTELCALRLFGAANVRDELERLAARCEAAEGGDSDG